MDRPKPSTTRRIAPTDDVSLARTLRTLSSHFAALAADLDAGKGSEPLGWAPRKTLRHRAIEIVRGYDALPLTQAADERALAERTVQIKANLLAVYRHCRAVFNRLKGRAKRPSDPKFADARRIVLGEFQQIVEERRSVFPFPLTPQIQEAARRSLELLLTPDTEVSPLAATVAPLRVALKKYHRTSITDDFVRQGASNRLGIRGFPPAEPETNHAILESERRLIGVRLERRIKRLGKTLARQRKADTKRSAEP
jgi:hypothetical protein